MGCPFFEGGVGPFHDVNFVNHRTGGVAGAVLAFMVVRGTRRMEGFGLLMYSIILRGFSLKTMMPLRLSAEGMLLDGGLYFDTWSWGR